MTMNSRQVVLCAVLVVPMGHATACERVEYAEAKIWSNQRLERAYCQDLSYNFARLEAQLDRKMGYAKSDAEVCRQQMALYKRLLESRGKNTPRSCK